MSPLQLGKLFCFHLYSASTAAGPCPCFLSPFSLLSLPSLLSLVAGKVNEMEQNEMYTLAHKYTPTHTHTTHQNILSKCRPEGPENIQDVSAAVMPKKTVEYSVLCYLVSYRGGR